MWPYRLAALLTATLFAALAPVLVVACFDPSAIRLLPFVLMVTLAHTIVLGLPCFLVLDGTRGVSAISALKAGVAIGAVPSGILGISALGGTYTWTGGEWVNAARTLAGWLSYFGGISLCGALGALAGLVFWFTLKAYGWNAVLVEIEEPRFRRHRSARIVTWAGGLAVAFLLTSGVFAISAITKDRTCHNMTSDGRSSVSTGVVMYVSIEMEDWPKLTKIFERFAAEHAMSMRNSSRERGDSVRALALSLCTDQGANIWASDQRWAHENFASLYGWGTHVGVREVHGNWQQLAKELLAEVEAAWPRRVTFRDGKSRVIPTPKELLSGSGEP
jgi:hypothetical protein